MKTSKKPGDPSASPQDDGPDPLVILSGSEGSPFFGTVRDLTLKGLGVVDHPEGQVFFVPGVWPGDEGEFAPQEVHKRYGFARLVKLVTLSSARVDSPCPHHGFELGTCGGCPWLMIDYAEQLKAKEKLIHYQWQKANVQIPEQKIFDIWPSKPHVGYRNRAQLKTDGEHLGFVSPGSKVIAAIDDCLMLTEKNRATLRALKKMLPRADWRPKGEKFLWNFLEVDESVNANSVVLNRRLPFRQANDFQNQRMRQWLREKIQHQDFLQAPVVELFCGSGNFTQVLQEHWQEKILAVEVSEISLKQLQEKNFPNVLCFATDLFKERDMRRLKTTALHTQAKTLVLDPPREGFPLLANFLNEFPLIENIFYISCNIETFIKDIAKANKAKAIRAIEIQPVDQFPHTPHIEICASLKC